ncbi:MAG: Zn-ribbon domain-containing OB-fold protein [Actinobacteria bacterium]|nr:MAG: Zn-ribbon domain-containing OB-fold protein [Actinomycetota bacterium]
MESGEMAQPFRWTAGAYGSKFLTELRDNKKFVGVKCPKCGKVYVPPRRVCGPCYVELTELVPVSGEGEVVTYTVVSFGFVDPATGTQKPVPYGYAAIMLDGSDTVLLHFIDETDPEKITIGARVKAVFEEERTGSLLDIKHFELIRG